MPWALSVVWLPRPPAASSWDTGIAHPSSYHEDGSTRGWEMEQQVGGSGILELSSASKQHAIVHACNILPMGQQAVQPWLLWVRFWGLCVAAQESAVTAGSSTHYMSDCPRYVPWTISCLSLGHKPCYYSLLWNKETDMVGWMSYCPLKSSAVWYNDQLQACVVQSAHSQRLQMVCPQGKLLVIQSFSLIFFLCGLSHVSGPETLA